MASQSVSGQRWVLFVITVMLGISVLAIGIYFLAEGAGRLPGQTVRFVLTAALCFYLYEGANWARWVSGILLAIGGLGATVGGAALLPTSGGLVLFTMGVLYLACSGILFFVPDVRRHFGR